MSRGILLLGLASVVGAVGLADGGSVLVTDEAFLAPGLTASPFTGGPASLQENDGPAYNGQFTYIRIRYGGELRDFSARDFGGRGWGRGGPMWAHDYPDAEINFSKIVNATTFIDAYMGPRGGRVLTLDDPELFNYPIATIIEAGYWTPSDEDIANLRAYLLKGGFLIADDIRDERRFEFDRFFSHMRLVLPEYQFQLVPDDHEIFNTFFSIPEPRSLALPYGRWNTPAPIYLGIFEDNDPVNGRLMVIMNGNQDIQEYWEFSDRGYYPIDLSNEAYKYGINYMIYAFTH